MGAGIAQLALEAGHPVVVHDVDAAAIEAGRARIRAGLERRAGRLDLDPESAEAWIEGRLARLETAQTLDFLAAAGPGLVIEAALEDLEAKRTIFRSLDAGALSDAILATNTSALSVGAIADATTRPGRVIGLHFFNPAPVMPLVEIVVARSTGPAVVERMIALMTAWGKVPVRCKDTPGFVVNRVNRPFTLEALAILAEGNASIERVDAAIRGAGFPMGPFELMDLVGIDVNLAAARGVFDGFVAYGHAAAERFRPSPIQAHLVADGRLGRKTDAGFYLYDAAGQRVGPAPDFASPTESVPAVPDDDIVERITLAIINEAYRALGDGVATGADIDLAMRLGAGHPMGPFERATVLGGPAAVATGLRRHATNGLRFDPAAALVAAGS
jgi:3-hydroxybutyryl-CoA dehydrogenase